MNNLPAFPPNAGWRDDKPECRGMTLRDYFAAKAMAEFVKAKDSMSWKAKARRSYLIADAMLEARE